MNLCYPTKQVAECQNCKRFRLTEPAKRVTPIIDASVLHRQNRACPLWKPFIA